MATKTTSTKIRETITKIAELQAVKRHFDSTTEELESVLDKKDAIETLMIKELEDINNLEKFGIKSIFHKVLGNKEEQLEKERQEYLQVTLQHKEILNAVEVVEFERSILEKKLVVIDELEKSLEILKEHRSNEILVSSGPIKNSLLLLHQKMDHQLKIQVELKEALVSGESTLNSLTSVYNNMKKAKDWGNWDMMGGSNNGRYHKSMKHGSIDRAMQELSRTKLHLRTFNKEISDVGYSNQRLGLQIDNIARFPSVIFDNLISDWIVQNKIKGVLSTVGNLIDDVKLITKSISRDMDNSKVEFENLDNDRHQLLEEN